VKRPRNPLLEVIFVFAFSVLAFSSATDVYITPDGSSQGVCTSNPQTPAWFNSSSNWGSGSSQIGPGTTVHLCGVFSGAAASNVLTTQGNGANSNPITIKFEAGARISAPSCGTFSTNPTGGCMSVKNQWVTVDGNNTGVIQSTLNGTSGNTCPGGTCSLNNPTAGVYVGASNVVVKNLTVADMYDRIPCGSNTEVNQQWGIVVDGGASAFTNVTVSGNTIHDAQQGVVVVGGSTNISNMTITQNTIYHSSSSISVAEGGGAAGASNFTISFNDIYDGYYWWDTGDGDHLNGMHLFAAAPGTSMNNFTLNGNYVHGDFGGSTCGGGGSHTTALIFFETTGGGTGSGNGFYNNLLVSGKNDDPSNGLLNLGDPNDSGALVANNTFVGANDGSGYSIMAGGTFTWKNNVTSGLTYGLYANGAGGSQVIACDHNNYYQPSTGWRLKSTIYSPFSSWQTAGYDANGDNANPNLNADYTLPSGSPAIGLGANLTSLGIAALNTGAPQTFGAGYACGTGCLARGASGNWDAGAYPYGTGDAPPNPPTGLAAVVN